MRRFFICICKVLLLLVTGCYNTGPEWSEWDRIHGEGTYSLIPVDQSKFTLAHPVGACVLDGTLLLINKDSNGERSLVHLTGEPYKKRTQCVWNRKMVSPAFDFFDPCLGECFEHPRSRRMHPLYLYKGHGIYCCDDWKPHQTEEEWATSPHKLPYIAPTALKPSVFVDGVRYDMRTRHRTGKATVSSKDKSYTFSVAGPASFEAFAMTNAADGSGKRFYFLLQTYYPSLYYLAICDESLRMIYFNPLDMQSFTSFMYFFAYEPSISPHILLVTKDFYEPPRCAFEIVNADARHDAEVTVGH